MKKTKRSNPNRQTVQATIVRALCQEYAIDCGYAAIGAIIEGQAWKRNQYTNLLRRLTARSRTVESLVTDGAPLDGKR